jgi:ADP-ribose pyrophosphatase YjhB (NUDIX family)
MARQKKAVIAVIKDCGQILMALKGEEEEGRLAGLWHVPGETLENGETDEDALHRGMREEANIEIKIMRHLGQHITAKNTEVNWYECWPLSYELQAGSDVTEVQWVPRYRVMEMCGERARTTWPSSVQDYFSRGVRIPLSFSVNTGDEEDAHRVSENFIMEAYYEVMRREGLPEGKCMHPYFDRKDGEIARHQVITNDAVSYLRYQERVVAAVFRTRTDLNWVQYDFFLSL